MSVALGVRAEVHDDEDNGRPFTTDELNRIFRLPLFSGCSDGVEPKGLLKPGDIQVRDDRFWIPLVLLLTGGRSSEIAGLATDDVHPDHDTPHLIIQPNELRNLKNRHSRRMVPVHPYLKKMGFLEFARGRVASGEKQFFPMVEQLYYNDRATGTVQKKPLSNSLMLRQFNRTLLGHAKADDNGGSIKCFRNTFEQESLARVTSDEFR
jgi:integrase